jgi:arginine exporter protein ArgO
MVNLRELAAIDLRFLGRTLVLLEYAFGVVLLVGIGVLGLIQTHARSLWWWYMVGIGVNYIPLLYYAVLLVRSRWDEVQRMRHEDMARLRRQQLWLLVPLAAFFSVLRPAAP